MCLIDGDTAEVWTSTTRKARKQHRCDECDGRISPGEEYGYHSGIQDGDPFSYHVCACCEMLWWVLWACVCHGEGATMMIGGLSHELQDHHSEMSSIDDDDNETPTLPGMLLQIYEENAEARAA